MRGACLILSVLFALAFGVGVPARGDTPEAPAKDHEIGKIGNPNPFAGAAYDSTLWEKIETHWDEAHREEAKAALKKFTFNPPENFLLPEDAQNLETAFSKFIAHAKDKPTLLAFLRDHFIRTDWPRWSYQHSRLDAVSLDEAELVEKIDYYKDFLKNLGNPSEQNVYGLRMELSAYTAALRTRLGSGVETFGPEKPWGSDYLEETYLTGKLLVTGSRFHDGLKEWDRARNLNPKGLTHLKARTKVVQAEYFWKETLLQALPDYSAEKAAALAKKLSGKLPPDRFPEAPVLAHLPVPASTKERALPEGLVDQRKYVQSVLDDGKLSTPEKGVYPRSWNPDLHLEIVDIYGSRPPEEVGFIVCEMGRCNNGAMASNVRNAEWSGSPVEVVGTDDPTEIPKAVRRLKHKGVKVLAFAGHGHPEAGVSIDGEFFRLTGKNLELLAPYVGDFEYVLFDSCQLGKCRSITENFSLMSGVPAFYNDHDLYNSPGELLKADDKSNWIITVPHAVARPSLRRPTLEDYLESARAQLERIPAFERLFRK